MTKKRLYFYVGVGIVLVILYGILLVAFFTPKHQVTKQPVTPAPTSPPATIAPLDTVQQQATRTSLSAKEQALRSQLIAPLGKGNSGYIHTEQTFSVVYLASADTFEVRIASPAIEATEEEGLQWFVDQGFQKSSLCSLPVIFYANKRLIQNANYTFNPVPKECR